MQIDRGALTITPALPEPAAPTHRSLRSSTVGQGFVVVDVSGAFVAPDWLIEAGLSQGGFRDHRRSFR